VLAGAGSVVVVVKAGDRAGSEMGIGTETIDAVGVVCVSRCSNKALNSAIAFRTLSGNGPVRDSAQYCSMRSSLASTFSTVSQVSFASHAGTVAGSVCVGVGMFVAAVGSTIAHTAIGAVRSCSLQ